MNPHRALCSYVESCGILWKPLQPYGPSAALSIPVEHCGALWSPLQTYGAMWSLIQPYGPLCGALQPHGLHHDPYVYLKPRGIISRRHENTLLESLFYRTWFSEDIRPSCKSIYRGS